MSRVLFIGGGLKVDFLGSHGISGPTYVFEDIDLGVPSSSGLLILGVGINSLGSSVTSVTVNGNAASETVGSAGSGRDAGLYQIAGESGVGDVTVNVGALGQRCKIALWQLRGVRNTTAYDTDSYSTTPPTVPAPAVSLDVPKFGAAIAFLFMDTTSTAHAWTGLPEIFEDHAETTIASGGSQIFNAAQTPLNVSVTPTGTSSGARMVAASWL